MCTLYLLNQIGWWCHNAINYNQLGLDLIFFHGHAESHEVSTSVWSSILKTFVTIPVQYTADTSPCINHDVNKNLNPWLIVRHDLTWFIAQTWQNLSVCQTMQTVITYRRDQNDRFMCFNVSLLLFLHPVSCVLWSFLASCPSFLIYAILSWIQALLTDFVFLSVYGHKHVHDCWRHTHSEFH